MLSCKEILARHSEYIDGVMTPPDSEQWRAHLAGCDLCARYDRVLRKGVSLLSTTPVLEPDPEFLMQLHYRLAHEDGRLSARPLANGTAVGVSVAAVLALVAWLPMMLFGGSGTANTASSQPTDATSAEIAWHGGIAAHDAPSHGALSAPEAALEPAHAAVALIDQRYTPLVIEPPTAPPSYIRVSFTRLDAR